MYVDARLREGIKPSPTVPSGERAPHGKGAKPLEPEGLKHLSPGRTPGREVRNNRALGGDITVRYAAPTWLRMLVGRPQPPGVALG